MRDLRYAIRVLLARPGFTAVALLTLALGIGANTAIFTVVNAVLLRPLPFGDPDRLVLLAERTSQLPTVTTSWPNYTDWRDQSRSFESVAAMRPLTMTLTGQAEPERIPAKMVTASLLPMLRVAPAIGRGVHRRRRSAGRGGRRPVERRAVAPALRRDDGRHRPRDHTRQPAVHDRRRAAAALSAASDGRRPVADRALGRDAAAGGSFVASRHLSDRTARRTASIWRPRRRRST